jgi:hypothetical protein
MEQWLIVTSKSGYGKDGLPVGEILCRYPEDVGKVIIEKGILNAEVKYFKPSINETRCEIPPEK